MSRSRASSLPLGRVDRDAAPVFELWQHGKGLTTRMALRTCFMGDPSADSKFHRAYERLSTELGLVILICP